MKLKCSCGNKIKFIGKNDFGKIDLYCRICGCFVKCIGIKDLKKYKKEFNIKTRGVK